MFSDTFVTVFYTLMGLISIFGLIWARGFNKETKRIRKEYEDQNLAIEKSTQS